MTGGREPSGRPVPAGAEPADLERPSWIVLSTGQRTESPDVPPTPRQVVVELLIVALAVMLPVGLLGVGVVYKITEREAVHDSAELTDVVASSVVMPALEDALLFGDEGSRDRLDRVVRDRVLGTRFSRVRVWSPDGVVLYSDDRRQIGRVFRLHAKALEALSTPATVAEVSDLQRPENADERDRRRLLEVYRPVWTPSGRPLLLETYAPIESTAARRNGLWRGFAGIVISALLLFVVLLSPLLLALLDRLRRARDQQEILLRHAIDASDGERRRIAADLHDGVVQELVATSLAVSASAEQPGRSASDAMALRAAAGAVRGGVAGLRTLLADIYPASVASSGLAAALADLGTGLSGRGLEIRVDVDPRAAAVLTEQDQQMVYRVARECLRNTVAHACAHTAVVRLLPRDGRVVLEIEDDGIGFDPGQLTDAAARGHVGIRIMADLAARHGYRLELASTRAVGTRWRLEVQP